MTFYAEYNNTVAQPAPVIGWYDTEFATYPNLPSEDSLVVLTQEQWSAHMANPDGWAVSGGTLVAYTPPDPPATPQDVYSTFIAGGLNITFSVTSALNGTYAMDQGSQQDIIAEAAFIATFSEFTNGTTSNLQWAQLNGTVVEFPTTSVFLAFAKIVAQTVAAAKIAVQNQSTTMPSSSVTVSA